MRRRRVNLVKLNFLTKVSTRKPKIFQQTKKISVFSKDISEKTIFSRNAPEKPKYFQR
jgi:hypothetical protein